MLSTGRQMVLAAAVGAVMGVPVAFAAGSADSASLSSRETPVRDCSTSAYGDLGRSWRERAVVAGPLAFVGMANGTRHVPPAPRGRSWPLKVLVVLEPRMVATVTIAGRARSVASLAYGKEALLRVATDAGGPVSLAVGDEAVRFEACSRPHVGEPWNRGTQFPGYFLVSGRRCVDLVVRVEGRAGPLRRTLRFGRTRCSN